ncbi:uncharacterized protein LOC143230093 isoform X2 [Tachypleus tridentatus]|uniref:uncharacterized protein LOC143230093 isoform X2 n=1 Tax=Tachypleus tridentatus TaxID=6853 RepID=UPI003FD67513
MPSVLPATLGQAQSLHNEMCFNNGSNTWVLDETSIKWSLNPMPPCTLLIVSYYLDAPSWDIENETLLVLFGTVV